MKFHNPTESLVAFNVARRMQGGMVVSNWVNVPGGEDLVTDDEGVAQQARRHTPVSRAMEGLKGHLVEVTDVVEKAKKK